VNTAIKNHDVNKKLYFVFCILIIAGQSMAQGLDEAQKKISSLGKKKVDTLVSVYRYSSGMNNLQTKKGKDCFLTASQLLIWTKDGEYFKQAFDNCNEYKEKKIDSSIFIKYIRDSIKVLKTAEILKVKCEFTDMAGTVHSKKDTPPINSKFTDITFFIGATSMLKKIDHYVLFKEACDEENVNVNYEVNMASILKRLYDEADAEMRDK
jgi:hypothetical protein